MRLSVQKYSKVDTKPQKNPSSRLLALLDASHRQVSIAPLIFLAHPCVDGEGICSLTKRVQSLLEPVSDIRPKLEPPVHRCMVLKCFPSIAMMLSPHPLLLSQPSSHFFHWGTAKETPNPIYIFIWLNPATSAWSQQKKRICLTNPKTPILIWLIRPWVQALLSCKWMWFYQQWLTKEVSGIAVATMLNF